MAVHDLDEALATYVRLFGAELEHRALVEDQGVEAAAVLVGSGRVELLAPLDEETPVGKFLASQGPGMHHVAYEVDDVRSELGRLSAAGAELIDDEPRHGLFVGTAMLARDRAAAGSPHCYASIINQEFST